MEVCGDSERFSEFVLALEESGETSMGSKASALLRMLRGVIDLVSRTDPTKLEPLLKNIAQGFGTLSPELLLELLSTEKGRADKAADLVLQVASRMTDATLGGFVANGVIAQGGATTRLAQAFQALVPDNDRRPGLLEIARAQVAESPLGPDRRLPRHVEERGRHADVVQRRAVRVGGLRARAVWRAHAGARSRARLRRSARAHRSVGDVGRRRGGAGARSAAAARPADDRNRPGAVEERDDPGREPHRGSAARRRLRRGAAADDDPGDRSGRRRRPQAGGGGGAGPARRRRDDDARRHPPSIGRRTRPSSSCKQLCYMVGPVDRQGARRSARDRKARRRAPAVHADSARLRRRRKDRRRAAARVGEPGRPADRDPPAARIRRLRGAARPDDAARRHRAARAARGGARHSLDRHGRGVCRAAARAGHRLEPDARSAHHGAGRHAERARDSALRVHRPETRSQGAAPLRLPARGRIARRAEGRAHGRSAEGRAVRRRMVGAVPHGRAAADGRDGAAADRHARGAARAAGRGSTRVPAACAPPYGRCNHDRRSRHALSCRTS